MEINLKEQIVERTSGEFASQSEEIQYLKTNLQKLKARNDELEGEMQDYHEQSQVYEHELESSCENSEKKISDLQRENASLTNDLEKLMIKLKRLNSANSSLQSKTQELIELNGQFTMSIRKLELENDKFEKEIRETKVAFEEMEKERDLALEKMALLETELEQFENLKVLCQRLKDENTDLKQQYQADLRKLKEDSVKVIDPCIIVRSVDESNSFVSFTETDDDIASLENAHNQSRDQEAEPQARVNNTAKKISNTELDQSDKGETQDPSSKKQKVSEVLANEGDGAKTRKNFLLNIKSPSFRNGKRTGDDKKTEEDKNKDVDKGSKFSTLLRRLRYSTSWRKHN